MTDDVAYKNGVSVVMCTYNGARYLREQLDSIVNQTLQPLEVIVQDDGSTDDTLSIIHEYEERYLYIRSFKNEMPRAESSLINVNNNFFSAMRRAKGEFIALSDQDDIWELDKLEVQYHSIGNHLMVAGISRPFAADGINVNNDRRMPNISLLRMLYLGVIPGHVQMIRREMLEILPPCDQFMYDLQTQVVAAAAESIVFLPRTLVNQRRHESATTYSIPVNNRRTMKNILYRVRLSLELYTELRPIIIDRFHGWLDFFSKLDVSTVTVADAVRMSQLQVSNSLVNKIRLMVFCIRKHRNLFATNEQNRFLSLLRAAFFPVSCCFFYRYLSQKHPGLH
jgi:glycosyltransferase involved in cell wall biosynthesis